ncbi:MAG: Bacterial regulatory protein Fis family, partial [Neobacillus sp.]|nr:Bacterial regulatory protein Fis family [Neobacillus sp.]
PLKRFVLNHYKQPTTTETSPGPFKSKIRKQDIDQAMYMAKNNVTKAAKILNISRQNLQYYLKKFT